jgi:hypothetical protein
VSSRFDNAENPPIDMLLKKELPDQDSNLEPSVLNIGFPTVGASSSGRFEKK